MKNKPVKVSISQLSQVQEAYRASITDMSSVSNDNLILILRYRMETERFSSYLQSELIEMMNRLERQEKEINDLKSQLETVSNFEGEIQLAQIEESHHE